MKTVTVMLYGLAAALVAVLLVWVALDDRRAVPITPPVRTQVGRAQADSQATERSPPTDQIETSAAEQRQLELASMSSSFRNETFLVAIRDAGYRCVHFLEVIPRDLSDSGFWLMRCDDYRSYLVGVDDVGELVVEPAPYAEMRITTQP
jgi:hypothetical protein